MKNYENQVKNMENRTDLALESYENQRKTVLPGVKVREQDGISVVEVLDARGEKALGKPVTGVIEPPISMPSKLLSMVL